MSLTKDDVTKIARLARIKVSDQEKDHYVTEISGILGWVEQLGEVDTKGVPQLASVSHATLPWRKDEVTDGHKQKEVLKNAPESDYGCFAVPKVVE